MSSETPREEIAAELATAREALQRAQEIDNEEDALSRSQRENVSIPMGRLKAVQNELPDPNPRTEDTGHD